MRQSANSGIRPWMFFTGVAMIAAAIIYSGQQSSVQRDNGDIDLDRLAVLSGEVLPAAAPDASPW